jgi:60 kDa SS-A/Ro ribonucleoprotein
LMFKMFDEKQKLDGYTIFVVDVSGSMDSAISSKSDFSRLDAAKAMAILAKGMCQNVSIYATAGSDSERKHNTKLIENYNGFELGNEIRHLSNKLGRGGIFTRQCLEFIKEKEGVKPDRIIIFSDSQDCDYPERRIPKPFGKRNYIVDISAHSRGINYSGVWDAEISGWSEHFFDYILEIEKSSN